MRDLWRGRPRPRPGLDPGRATRTSADRIAGYRGAFQRKRALAAEAVRLGLPLTVNLVVHRANIERIGAMVELALELAPRASRSRMRSITAGR